VYYVYIVECADATLYTGITTDLERRLHEHRSGQGGRYTSSRGVIQVLYAEEHPDRSSASKREAEIKRWPRRKKLEFIEAGILRA
jgi:putative endonuclease